MRRPSLRPAALLVALTTSTACAHAPAGTPEETADGVLGTLNALTSVDGATVCASERVQADRVFQALQSNEKPAIDRSDASGRDRTSQWETQNLSQLTAAMTQAFVDGSTAGNAGGAGVLSAASRARSAQESFDALMTTAESRDMRAVGQGTSPTDLISVQYAAVWSEYFGTLTNTTHNNQLLDWLTTRSMTSPELLRLYHQDFTLALSHRCS